MPSKREKSTHKSSSKSDRKKRSSSSRTKESSSSRLNEEARAETAPVMAVEEVVEVVEEERPQSADTEVKRKRRVVDRDSVLAEFDSPKSLYHVAQKVRDEGYTKWDAFSPFPIHGMDGAMGLKESILGWIVVIGGAVGLSFGFGLQTWVATTAYKIIVSGKPLFSYQAFVPVTFELMVLFSAFAAVFGMFILNRLPQHYHPLFY